MLKKIRGLIILFLITSSLAGCTHQEEPTLLLNEEALEEISNTAFIFNNNYKDPVIKSYSDKYIKYYLSLGENKNATIYQVVLDNDKDEIIEIIKSKDALLIEKPGLGYYFEAEYGETSYEPEFFYLDFDRHFLRVCILESNLIDYSDSDIHSYGQNFYLESSPLDFLDN